MGIGCLFFVMLQVPEEMEIGDDFDDLTQSSDTGTDEADFPTSGFRNASLLIQQLDSSCMGNYASFCPMSCVIDFPVFPVSCQSLTSHQTIPWSSQTQ